MNEWAGLRNHNTAQFWEYDTRTGRRLNLDPMPSESRSNYSVFINSPIWRNDEMGDTDRIANYYHYTDKNGKGVQGYFRNNEQKAAWQREWDRAKATLKKNGFGKPEK